MNEGRRENWKKGNGHFTTAASLSASTTTIISFQILSKECQLHCHAVMEPAEVNRIFICRLWSCEFPFFSEQHATPHIQSASPHTHTPFLSLVLELPLLEFDTIFTPVRALHFHRVQLRGLQRDGVYVNLFWSGANSF